MSALLGSYAFLLGAVVGSFLNVVIHRYPLGESIVFPASRCPGCKARIRAWDNVPIVSYLLLLGRCRDCKKPISSRYPLVELSNALFYLAVFLRTGLSIAFLPLAMIVSMTLVLIYIDFDIQILPDVVDLPGIALGLLIGWLRLGDGRLNLMLASDLLDSVLGAALGAAILLAIALLYKLIRKIEGMGMGDVKMMAMIGAVTGWRPIPAVLFVASFAGAAAGILLALREKQGLQIALPFGVFLGLSFLTIVFFGRQLGTWYAAALLS